MFTKNCIVGLVSPEVSPYGPEVPKILALKRTRLPDEPFFAVVSLKTFYQFKVIFSRGKTIIISHINEKTISYLRENYIKNTKCKEY